MQTDIIEPINASELVAWRERALNFERELGKAIIGQTRVIRLMTVAIFARGHVLLEGDVGVGKTTLLRAAARAIGGAYERIEGTVDLMPGDLVYNPYIDIDGKPKVDFGPVIRHGKNLTIFFFNEINRARPQVHSLLLRLMAERSATAFNSEFHFPYLLVFADRNRIEREETFELPAAARDRFFMEINIETPEDPEVRRRLIFDQRFHDGEALIGSLQENIIDYRALGAVSRAIQGSVSSSDALERYTLQIWRALRSPQSAGIKLEGVDMGRLINGGASPRGMAFLIRAARVQAWLEGRDFVAPEDLRAVFFETVAHRIFFDPVYELRRDAIVKDFMQAIIETVPAP